MDTVLGIVALTGACGVGALVGHVYARLAVRRVGCSRAQEAVEWRGRG